MRYLSLVLAALLLMGGMAFADAPDYQNVIYTDGSGETGVPPMYVRRVRYGKQGGLKAGRLTSGTVVSWDITSNDAITISACTSSTAVPCGVLVTDALTQDTSVVADSNWAFMAVRGYCLASVDTSECTLGQPLTVSEQCDQSALLSGRFGTINNYVGFSYLTKDIGVLLNVPTADAKVPVYLTIE